MSDSVLLFLVVVLGASVTLVPISARLGLGSVIGYLTAGLIIGPQGLGLIKNPEEVLHLAEFGVVLLLFLIGLELNPKRLWSLRQSIFGLGLLQVLLTSALISGSLILIGWDWRMAMVAGMGLSMSSTAIAMQLIEEQGLRSHPAGQKGFAVLLFQDLAVIPILISVSFLGTKVSEGTETSMATQIVSSLLAIGGIVVVGRYLTRPVFRWITGARVRELSVAFSLLIVFGISFLMYSVGLSMALGAFLAGVILAESEYRHELEANIEPFKGLLLGLFFLAVGMGVQINLIVDRPLELFGYLFGFLLLKISILYGLGIIFRMDKRHILLFAFLLSQGGEFAFVLFGQALQASAIDQDAAALLNGVVTLSMLTTPLFLIAYQKLLAFRQEAEGRAADTIEEEGHSVIIAGFGRMGQIVARLLNLGGFKSTVIDHNPEHIDRVRRFGYKAYYGDASQMGILEAAGIKHIKLLVITIDHQETVNRLVEEVQRLYPHVLIAARARDRVHAYQLMDKGVRHFERETFGSALNLGQTALRLMGIPSFQALRTAQRFRNYDLDLIEKLYPLHKDESQVISQTREARDQLERLFVQDAVTLEEDEHKGWG